MKITCPHCQCRRNSQDESRTIKRSGTYYRRSDGQRLARYWCFSCKKSFSAATTSTLRNQKKRQFNRSVVKLLTGGVSQREAARILKINVKTVVRKFLFMSDRAAESLRVQNRNFASAIEIEFDDMETFEHTKCKPLSITLMVEHRTRRILGYRVSQMPAKGLLAAIALKKYGHRADLRALARRDLFQEMQPLIARNAIIRSDSNPHYKPDVDQYFPDCRYETVLSRRAAVVGQGELKKIGYDPIFSINHTCAMLRAHINRLFRRTWCTTKKPDRLVGHIALYALEHNRRLATD